ncbi:MAG: flagellar biosynthetic protein FliQ, partial [Acetobacteraceae bacterium]
DRQPMPLDPQWTPDLHRRRNYLTGGIKSASHQDADLGSNVNDTDTAMLLRDGMLVMLKLGGPPLLVALAVGLLVALLQAVTQINEATLAFVPKVLALCAALMVLGPYMLSTLSSYTHTLLDRLIVIGGS